MRKVQTKLKTSVAHAKIVFSLQCCF